MFCLIHDQWYNGVKLSKSIQPRGQPKRSIPGRREPASSSTGVCNSPNQMGEVISVLPGPNANEVIINHEISKNHDLPQTMICTIAFSGPRPKNNNEIYRIRKTIAAYATNLGSVGDDLQQRGQRRRR